MSAITPLDFSFQGNSIRCTGTDRDLWFVAKDVCAVLDITWKASETLADILPEWRGVRKFWTPHSNQYGRSRLVETELLVITEQAVFQLASRSRTAAAREFQRWLYGEVLPAIRRTGSYTSARKEKYLALGKTEEWIEAREEGIEQRKSFTDTLKDHEVEKQGFGQCTNAVYVPLLGATAAGVKVRRGLPVKANLRDSLSTDELSLVKVIETTSAAKIEKDGVTGNEPCAAVCQRTSTFIAEAVRKSLEA